MRISKPFLTYLLAVLMFAVTATPLAGTQETGELGSVTGTVANHELVVRGAGFTWTENADDMTIALASTEDACTAMHGDMQGQEVTILAIMLKHNTRELRDAPFTVGVYPIRGEGEREPQDATSAFHVESLSGPRELVRATGGFVELTEVDLSVDGRIVGIFELSFGVDKIRGTFEATF